MYNFLKYLKFSQQSTQKAAKYSPPSAKSVHRSELQGAKGRQHRLQKSIPPDAICKAAISYQDFCNLI